MEDMLLGMEKNAEDVQRVLQVFNKQDCLLA